MNEATYKAYPQPKWKVLERYPAAICKLAKGSNVFQVWPSHAAPKGANFHALGEGKSTYAAWKDALHNLDNFSI
jgi:hypothetical protein